MIASVTYIAPVVLVVEDEPLVRMTAADELEEYGFHVLEAANADEALTLMEGHAVDVQVLFTDLNMPGSMDGIALAEEVHRRWPHIHLLISSGREELQPDEIPNHGHFVAKPYVAAHVVGHIHDLIKDAGQSANRI
jgi:two-component system, response regulator PdtaR